MFTHASVDLPAYQTRLKGRFQLSSGNFPALRYMSSGPTNLGKLIHIHVDIDIWYFLKHVSYPIRSWNRMKRVNWEELRVLVPYESKKLREKYLSGANYAGSTYELKEKFLRNIRDPEIFNCQLPNPMYPIHGIPESENTQLHRWLQPLNHLGTTSIAESLVHEPLQLQLKSPLFPLAAVSSAKAKFIEFVLPVSSSLGRFLRVSVFLFKERGRLPRRAGRQTRGAEPWHEEAVRNRDLVATSTGYKSYRSSAA